MSGLMVGGARMTNCSGTICCESSVPVVRRKVCDGRTKTAKSQAHSLGDKIYFGQNEGLGCQFDK